ncbi:hypothetical protein AAF712_015455 [Marasmius tenuissimus]|uniref:Alpha/beta hydrolase fold-3 domain-containing protein n=1 Tax=Marasmius tenuissimus TaxID=585030 RepID=A0ABR2Z998_9AGAR
MLPITTLEKITLIPKLLPLSLVFIYTALVSRFSNDTTKKKNTFGRLLMKATIRYLGAGLLTAAQIQWMSGPTSPDVYRKWAMKQKIEPVIEDVPASGKKLMWIGNKDAEHIVFHVHVPIADYMFTFWHHVLQEYKKRTGKEDLAVVCPEYSLYPHSFPTQLRDIIHAFAHILSTSRATPSTIHLAGDSAGGNIVMQFLSHALHPLPSTDVPPSPLGPNQRLRGTLLISPWLTLGDPLPSHTSNDGPDWGTNSGMKMGGELYLKGIEKSHIPYTKVLSDDAGERWLEGLEKLTERVLATAGGKELILDDAVEVYERVERFGKGKIDAKLDVEEDGLHEDMMMEFATGGNDLTEAGLTIVEWLVEGCRGR